MKTRAAAFFKQANVKLKEANEQLLKPEEDVVSYVVCKNAQVAIENYLRGYLLHNEVDPSGYDTIESLFQQCKKINKKFDKIDLFDLNCKSRAIDSTYCNEVSKVSNCYDVADNLDTLLRREKII